MKAGKYNAHDWRTDRNASADRAVFVAAWKAKFPMQAVPQFAVVAEDGSCRHWNEWPDGRDRCLPAGTFEITDERADGDGFVKIGNQWIQAHEALEID